MAFYFRPVHFYDDVALRCLILIVFQERWFLKDSSHVSQARRKSLHAQFLSSPKGAVMTMHELVDVVPNPRIQCGSSTRLQGTRNVPFEPHPEAVKLLSASRFCSTRVGHPKHATDTARPQPAAQRALRSRRIAAEAKHRIRGSLRADTTKQMGVEDPFEGLQAETTQARRNMSQDTRTCYIQCTRKPLDDTCSK